MGWGASASHTGTFNKGKEYGQEVTNTKGSFNNQAEFRPEGQQTLNSLAGYYGGVGNQLNTANRFYTNNVNGAGVNPYAQNVVDSSSKVAQEQFNNRLAQVRSGGFRGGAGRDTVNQSQFANSFTNQQQMQNMQVLMDAFKQQQGEKFASANALSQNGTAAQQFLALLRGESGTSESQAVKDFQKYFKNQSNSFSESVKYGT